MFGPKIKVSKRVYDKLSVASKIQGASSLEEFVERLLEKEADAIINSTAKQDLSKQEVEEIANSMKGLGYLE